MVSNRKMLNHQEGWFDCSVSRKESSEGGGIMVDFDTNLFGICAFLEGKYTRCWSGLVAWVGPPSENGT